jgi:FAD/FMN-containing dehydrogenase
VFTLENAIKRTRRYLKDMTTSVWTDEEIIDFINEGILVIKRKIPEYFYDLKEIFIKTDVMLLEDEYKNLPCIYAASRCFEQDEQHYRAVQRRNEFESIMEEMVEEIMGSYRYEQKTNDINNPYYTQLENDYVKDVYFDNYSSEDEILPLEP